MHKRTPLWRRILSSALALLLALGSAPVREANAAEVLVSDPLSDEMAYSHVVYALEYLGYDIQFFRDNDMLFELGSTGDFVSQGYYIWPDHTAENEHITYMDPEAIRTDIDYNNRHYGTEGGFNMGLDTIEDSSTKTGKAPDVAKFEEEGWPCLSFLNYYFFNYLTNIVGLDSTELYELFPASKPNETDLEIEHYLGTVENWRAAMDAFAAMGKAKRYSTLPNTPADEQVSNSEDVYQYLTPGDVMIFGQEGGTAHSSKGNIHVGIYAGTRKIVEGKGDRQQHITEHFFIHMPSGDGGPEISTVRLFAGTDSSKASVPNTWYHILPGSIPRLKEGIIEINKADDNGNMLQGAYFQATNVDTGKHFEIGPTNANGYARIDELPLGTYKVVETVFPEGYKAGDVTEWTVTIDENTPNYTIAINAVNKLIAGNIRIIKNTNTGEHRSGWIFDVLRASDRVKVGTYTTGEGGTVTTGPLPPGDYIVVESGGAGYGSEYWLCDDNEYTVTVEEDKVTDHTVTNIHYGRIEVIKNTNTGANRGGWTFNILQASDRKLVDVIITNDNGYAVSKQLPAGSYIVLEVDGPGYGNGYWDCDVSEKTATVKVGETERVTVTNNYNGRVQIIKNTNTGTNRGGWIFDILKASDRSKVATLTTNDQGVALSGSLAPGAYIVVEVGGPGFGDEYWVCDVTEQQITVASGETSAVTFTNNHYGKIQVIKYTNTGKDKDGWVFDILRASDRTKVASVTTNADGLVTSPLLAPGSYIVVESGGKGFDSEYWDCDVTEYEVTVVAGQTDHASFWNSQYGKIQVIKNTNTGADRGGWSFNILDADNRRLVETITTNAQGIATSGKLPRGAYIVVEVSGPGYGNEYWECDVKEYTITVEAGDTASHSVTNTHYGKIQVVKNTNTGANRDGWSFDILRAADKSKVETITTDASGIATSSNLEPGKYIVVESGGIGFDDDYWECDVKEYEIVVTAGSTASHSVTNNHYGRIEVIKNTNTGANREGWTFDILRAADKVKVATIKTDADGKAVSPNLEPGSYIVVEVDGPGYGDGYWECDVTEYTLAVRAGNTERHSITNNHYGRIQIVKITNTNQNRNGWSFDILRASDRLKVETVTTDENGIAASSNLEPGNYIVVESGGIGFNDEYWECDVTEYTVSVVAGSATIHNVTNNHYGKIQVVKNTNTGNNREGWSFDILRAEDRTKVETIKTDENGVAISSNLEPGSYIVVESDGTGFGDSYWECDVTEYTITVEAGKTAQHSVTNTHYGKLQIIKEMATDGPLDGWQFKITRLTDGALIGTFESDENGKVLVDNLLPGDYKVEELLEENGLYFCKGETTISVTVTEGETLEVTFVNALRAGRIVIVKENQLGELLADAKFLLEWSEDGINWYPVTYSDAENVVKGSCSTAGLTDGCLVTDATGKIVFENLYPTLQYRVTELEAPNGYEKLSDYAFEGFLPDETLEVSFSVINCPVYELPATGMEGFSPFVAIGAAAFVLMMGLGATVVCMYYLNPATKKMKGSKRP